MYDVQHGEKAEFKRSRFFTRGWSLQETLASKLKIFLTDGWDLIGCVCGKDGLTSSSWWHRAWTMEEAWAASPLPSTAHNKQAGLGDRIDRMIRRNLGLEPIVAEITDVSEFILSRPPHPLSSSGVDGRLSWQSRLGILEDEDLYYGMFGIFDVSIPIMYGEGADNARRRPLQEIIRRASTATSTSIAPDDTQSRASSTLPAARHSRWKALEPLGMDRYHSSVTEMNSAPPSQQRPQQTSSGPLSYCFASVAPWRRYPLSSMPNCAVQVRVCFIIIFLGVLILGGQPRRGLV